MGATIFDVWNPLYQSAFIRWAPATLVIRGLMGFIIGKLRDKITSNLRVSEVLAMIISHVWKNTAYFAYDYWLFGPAAYLDLITFYPLTVIDIIVATSILAYIRKALRIDYVA